jgi:TolB-like protein/AraC-like DNA-binding protein/Tfp pilus assembly protein PilF
MEQDFLKKLTEITEANLGNHEFGVNELANEMNMSHSSLFRKLNSINGKSINQFIKEIRLWKALELLQKDGLTASEVAHITGFSSAAYFSNCFHEYFGYPPGEAKNKHRVNSQTISKTEIFQDTHLNQNPEEERNQKKFRKYQTYWKKKKGLIIFSAATGFTIILFCVVFFTVLSNSEAVTKEQQKTLAVLPFEDLSTKPASPWFIYGFKQDIVTDLSAVKGILIRSEISTEAYRDTKKPWAEIARELNVNYLVTGALGIADKQFKVWVQLFDVKGNHFIWSSDTIYKQTNDLFSAQSEITKDIVQKLKEKISPEEIRQIDKKLTENSDAYAQYQKGQYFNDGNRGVQPIAAMEAFRKAFELDPRFTEAYLGFAQACLAAHALDLASYQESMPIITWAMEKAREIDPDNPGINWLLSYYDIATGKNKEAILIFDSMLRIDPGSPGAHFNIGKVYRNLGNWEKGKEHLVKAASIYEKSFTINFHTALTFDMLRDFPEALKYYNQMAEFNPRHSFSYLYKSDLVIRTEGDTRKALSILDEPVGKFAYDGWDMMAFYYRRIWIHLYEGSYEKALEILGGIKGFFPDFYSLKPVAYMYAITYSFLNKPDLEKQYWDSTRYWIMNKDTTFPDDPRPMSTLGVAWAGLGKKDKAIELGKKAVELCKYCQNPILESFMIENLAYIFTRVGNYQEAIHQLKKLLSVPSRITPRLLALDPRWIPLRNLSGFKKLASI